MYHIHITPQLITEAQQNKAQQNWVRILWNISQTSGLLNRQFSFWIQIRCTLNCPRTSLFRYGSLARYVKLRVAHAPGMPGTFSPPPQFRDPEMHHGTCVSRVPWCMPGSLTSGFLCGRWRGKRSRHSRRMRNPYLARGPWIVRKADSWTSIQRTALTLISP